METWAVFFMVYAGTGIGAGDRSCIHEQGQDRAQEEDTMCILCIHEQEIGAVYKNRIHELNTGAANRSQDES